MTTNNLQTYLSQHSEALVADWVARIGDVWKTGDNPAVEVQLERQCTSLLEEIVRVLPDFNGDESWEPEASSGLIKQLTEVGATWASKGLMLSETSSFILSLKRIVIVMLQDDKTLPEGEKIGLIISLEKILDRLLVICHEAFVKGRERLIKQQSEALLELSSPVVKLWEHMLLLPLIGVIDTSRARQITESLLREIAKQEAIVTIIDLTGVPVFDTAVAGHLMKTVKAARMLGCQVIMTGISPEGSLVLTKLGIDFQNVVTRGNLHSGVREGFGKLKLTTSPFLEAN